ncbi:MAG: site-specific integrase [Candidatus Nanopelagicales bacterium]|nr:site-specific integrase [Candidatus Nanopelagicales bacterium]MCF8538218.1 site-specific integrase [Candidatus Nanopelagicales bacterium]MCF8542552.1 site-specific integrase [Candidatus Nanopelagicales bacterium]MCF8558313.1 site-specific integrase [Candidatus Nanopelagicales bacterium]
MSRRPGLEGSVREHPPGSGRWKARLPSRLDTHRRYIDGVFISERECRHALNRVITDLDTGRTHAPVGEPNGGPTRRVQDIVEDYIQDRRNDAFDPISVNTIRDYKDALKNIICRQHADLGGVPANRLDSHTIDTWFRHLRNEGLSHRRAAKGLAVLRAALAWETRAGRLTVNPAREVRRTTTKKGRGSRITADPVLLPSWRELADLAAHPDLWEDRLLILLIAWAGLRWSEAVGLSVSDVWPTRPRLSVRRTFAWDKEAATWEMEYVKGGNADIVPLPTPLWEALRDLAAGRTVTDQLAGDCLFRPTRDRYASRTALIIDSNNWRRRVWYAARSAAKLDGDPSLSTLDPRRRAIKVKDLRAYAASVVVDSGGTQYEAAALLRHSTVATTNTYYARAQDERSQDPARARLRVDLNLSLAERIDLLWTAWTGAYPDETAHVLEPGWSGSGSGPKGE